MRDGDDGASGGRQAFHAQANAQANVEREKERISQP